MPDSIKPIIVTTSHELEHVCALLAGESVIALDTEFIREKTYYPLLCLVQIATDQDVIFIDPLSDNLDVTPLWHALMRSDLIKVMHSGRQDIEIIFKQLGQIPPNLFDTQIAVQFLGVEDVISYETLVKLYLNQIIDKSAQRSNWIKRPLTVKQIQYAAGDVYLLRQIYFILHKQLANLNRIDWLNQEMAIMFDPQIYMPNYQKLFKQLGIERSITSKQSKQAIALIKVREHMAQNNDMPRQNVMTTEQVKILSKPSDLTLPMVAIACGHLSSDQHEEILTALNFHLNNIPEDITINSQEKARSDEVMHYLQLCVKAVAAKHQLSSTLITSNLNLAQFTSPHADQNSLSKGWRYEVIGQLIEKILASQAGLYIDQNKLTVKD